MKLKRSGTYRMRTEIFTIMLNNFFRNYRTILHGKDGDKRRIRFLEMDAESAVIIGNKAIGILNVIKYPCPWWGCFIISYSIKRIDKIIRRNSSSFASRCIGIKQRIILKEDISSQMKGIVFSIIRDLPSLCKARNYFEMIIQPNQAIEQLTYCPDVCVIPCKRWV